MGASLGDAAEKTISANGFHIEGTATFEGLEIETEGDYVAPDRFTFESSDGRSAATTTTIVVGRNNYSSNSDDAHRFTLWEMPCAMPIETFMPALGTTLHAHDVRHRGSAFTFRAEGLQGTTIDGEALVEDGYLVGLSLRYSVSSLGERVEESWVFSDFGSIASIEAPPAEQVEEQSQDGSPGIIDLSGEPIGCPA